MSTSKPTTPSYHPTSTTTKSRGSRSKYTPKACQECRRRRAKCDGNQPSCARCLQRQLSCTYTADEDNRGTAPKSYVRLLQARINLLERILRLHNIDIDDSMAQLLLLDNRDVSSATGESTSGVDQLCTAFEGILSLDEALNFESEGEPRFFGLTSGRLSFLAMSTNKDNPHPNKSIQDPDIHVHALPHENWGISEELESHLLNLYFTWEQPWFQVVDEALFYKSKKDHGRFYSPLLLNCILAIASRYSDRIEVRSDPTDANTAGCIFLETAEVLLQVDLKTPTITTLQSLAILGVAYIAFGREAAGWLHEGMAVRLSLDMGFHMDPQALIGVHGMDVEEAELRRQIYWALYCNDKLSVTYTGRACTMLGFQAAVNLPSPGAPNKKYENSDSTFCVPRSLLVSFQRALCGLSQILEEILCTLYSPKGAHGNRKRNFFDSCLLTLNTWYYDLPPELKPVKGAIPTRFPQGYTLCITYNTSVLLLAKPYLWDSEGLDQLQDQMAAGSVTLKAEDIYKEAAKQICSLSEHFRKTWGSFRQSPITATHCTLFAALALFRTLSQDTEEAIVYTDLKNFETCLQTLLELSVAWTPPRKYYHNLRRMMHNQVDIDNFSITELAEDSGRNAPQEENAERDWTFSTDELGFNTLWPTW